MGLHAKLLHHHDGVKMFARACKVEQRVQGRIKEFRTGSWCPYCGFEGNENARIAHQQVLDQILRRGMR